MQEFLQKARSELPTSDLKMLSNQAIDWIRREAFNEPENQKKLGLLKGSKKSTKLILGNAENRYIGEYIQLYFRWNSVVPGDE